MIGNIQVYNAYTYIIITGKMEINVGPLPIKRTRREKNYILITTITEIRQLKLF